MSTPDADRRSEEELKSLLSGPIVPLNAESLKTLAEAAQETMNGFLQDARVVLAEGDVDRYALVRRWRVDDGYSWRGVASMAYETWQGNWFPSSNQLMGMALCEVAAERFGEHYMDETWNG